MRFAIVQHGRERFSWPCFEPQDAITDADRRDAERRADAADVIEPGHYELRLLDDADAELDADTLIK